MTLGGSGAEGGATYVEIIMSAKGGGKPRSSSKEARAPPAHAGGAIRPAGRFPGPAGRILEGSRSQAQHRVRRSAAEEDAMTTSRLCRFQSFLRVEPSVGSAACHARRLWWWQQRRQYTAPGEPGAACVFHGESSVRRRATCPSASTRVGRAIPTVRSRPMHGTSATARTRPAVPCRIPTRRLGRTVPSSRSPTTTGQLPVRRATSRSRPRRRSINCRWRCSPQPRWPASCRCRSASTPARRVMPTARSRTTRGTSATARPGPAERCRIPTLGWHLQRPTHGH